MRFATVGLAIVLAFVTACSETRPTASPVPRQAPTSSRISGQVPELSVDQLGNFDFDDEKPVIPASVRALSGRTIRVHGYMVPIDQEGTRISRFALVLKHWSSGGDVILDSWVPKIQQTVIVTCPKNKPVVVTESEIDVEGILTVGPVMEDGYVTAVFAVALDGSKPVVTSASPSK